MKRSVLLIPFLFPSALFSEIGEDEALRRCYVAPSAAIVFPQGGCGMSRKAGGEARIGYYLDDFWAVEASAALTENRAGYGLNALWHWYGYERLDPFFLFGVKGWTGLGAGPGFGLGAFYHLDDDFSLKADAYSVLLADDADVVFSLSVGLQYSW